MIDLELATRQWDTLVDRFSDYIFNDNTHTYTHNTYTRIAYYLPILALYTDLVAIFAHPAFVTDTVCFIFGLAGTMIIAHFLTRASFILAQGADEVVTTVTIMRNRIARTSVLANASRTF